MRLEPSSPSEDEDDDKQSCRGAWQDRLRAPGAARVPLAALLAAGAAACGLVALRQALRPLRESPRERPNAAAALGLGAERAGAACSNWAGLAVGPGINVTDQVACALSCSSDPLCAHWNFMDPADGGRNCSAPWNCLLLREGCARAEDPCWGLFTRPSAPPASERAVPVFLHGSSGIGCYRIPAIVRTREGRLVAFSEARHDSDQERCIDSSAQEIAVSFSDDSGKTWSEVSFATGGYYDRAFNPYPIALDSGEIVLVYGKADGTSWDGHAGSGIGTVRSFTGGATWKSERDVTAQFGAANASQPGPGAGIAVRTDAGTDRLFVVSHRGAYKMDSITVSDDGGFTWRTLDVAFPEMDEGTIASLGGGELLLVMRHQNMSTEGRAVSRSHDFGETWSPIEYNDQLPSAVCQGQLLQHEGALYFSGPLEGEGAVRRFLVVRRSGDAGRSWSGDRLVHQAESSGYSAMVPMASSSLGVFFETARGIEFTTVEV